MVYGLGFREVGSIAATTTEALPAQLLVLIWIELHVS